MTREIPVNDCQPPIDNVIGVIQPDIAMYTENAVDNTAEAKTIFNACLTLNAATKGSRNADMIGIIIGKISN